MHTNMKTSIARWSVREGASWFGSDFGSGQLNVNNGKIYSEVYPSIIQDDVMAAKWPRSKSSIEWLQTMSPDLNPGEMPRNDV